MTGVLDGLVVLDLSWGISGPMTAMLLGDNGARVTKIEPPGGDPFRDYLSGYQVWNRGKRSAFVDLTDDAQRDLFLNLVDGADILVESFAPGTTTQLGIDYDTLHARNPRLIYCSITGYGNDGKHIDRRAIDALVSARTGHMWESRGVVGGTIAKLSGVEGIMPGLEAPEGCWVGAEREGPLFAGIPWPSHAACYLATLAISAAVRAREVTGRGQRVHTSLMQGAICSTLGAWQRVEHPEAENFQTWITDPRAPKGFFKTSDNRWTHHWPTLPAFVLAVSEGDRLELPEGAENPRKSGTRITMSPEDMVLLHHFTPELAERVAKFPGDEWMRIGAEIGTPVQVVRSPEEALLDDAFVGDGCVVEIEDPAVGRVRQVGTVYHLASCPNEIGGPPAAPGQHTAEVLAEAAAGGGVRSSAGAPTGTSLSSPLAGIRVLDLGLAVAGPFGTQMLADLGAEVIKVNALHDDYWMANHIAMCCNRSKRSIAINLKDPEGLAILHELVKSADIVQHNMRYGAARRLGVDYDSLREINPKLIYCHTRGFEKSWRDSLPGNDQTGAALAGSTWMDGGLDDGGNPLWSVTSLGDTGNGFLSAIAMVQALYHRDKTGEGQFVDTSIVYAQLLNCSNAWITADKARVGKRQSLDAMQMRWCALYGLYETKSGWLCVAALTDDDWARVCAGLGRGDLVSDARFFSREARSANDAELTKILEEAFATRTAAEWFGALDAHGAPVEISNPEFVLGLFDDPEFIDKGWVTSYQHPVVGKIDVMGLLMDFSETPGKIWGPPFLPGQHTAEILRELGYDDARIEQMAAAKTVLDRRVPSA